MTGPRVWILDEEWPDHSLEIEAILGKVPNADICESSYEWQKDFDSFGRDADVIIAQVYADLPADLIGGLTRCKGIALMGGGFDRVDMVAAATARVPVCNVQGYCVEDIADYVIEAILHSLKPIDALDATRQDLPWGLPAVEPLQPRPSSCVLHVVGLGRIGSAVARLALAIGMTVIATDDRAPDVPGVRRTDLESGLTEADFVSLHCPLSSSTIGMIGSRELSLMKSGAVLINTARGGLIDERALADALNGGRLSGAVLDVVDGEPDHVGSPLFGARHALITPHISYASSDSLSELRTRSTSNALEMLAGLIPADCVNTAVFSTDRPVARLACSGQPLT